MASGRTLFAGKNAQSSAGRADLAAPPLPNRQGGLWNFLTWSFFLSQVLVAENFMGAPARAESDTDSARAADPSIAHASGTNGQPALAGHIAQPEDDTAHSHATVGPLQNANLHFPDGATVSLKAAIDWAGHGLDAGSATFAQALETSADHDAARLTANSAGNDEVSPVLALEPAVAPIDDVIGSLDGIVDNGLSPLLATLAPIAGFIGTTVEDIVAPLTNSIGSAVNALAGPIATEPILQQTVATIEQVAAPLPDALGLQGLVASAGSILVPDQPTAGTSHLDDLFSQGAYTPYNLALGAVPAAANAVTATVSSLGSSIGLGDNHDIGPHEEHGGTPQPHGSLVSALDDLHLRGSGDGLGLL